MKKMDTPPGFGWCLWNSEKIAALHFGGAAPGKFPLDSIVEFPLGGISCTGRVIEAAGSKCRVELVNPGINPDCPIETDPTWRLWFDEHKLTRVA